MACSSSGQEAHRQDAQRCRRRPGARAGPSCPGAGLDVTLHAEEAGDGEAPDVGIEHADHVTRGGQGDGQVHGDRRLADAALARGDGQDPGARRDRRSAGASSRAFQRARAITAARSSASMAAIAHLDRRHPVEGPRVADDVLLDLRAQGAGGDGQGHVDRDPAGVLADGPHHAQVDDGVAQLGVDHLAQAVAHLLLAGRAHRHGGRAGWSESEAMATMYLRGADFQVDRPLCRPVRRPGNMVGERSTVPRERPCQDRRRNEEEPVTTMSTSVNIGKKPAPVTLSDEAASKVAELLAQEDGRRPRPARGGQARAAARATATRCSSTPRS